MANYVKFMRGSLGAYENLKVKDNDTLYFVYDNDNPIENEGYLYLGNKLISGPCADEQIPEKLKLTDLKDVFIDANLDYDALLVYDANEKEWKNYSFKALIFGGATNNQEGLSGLVPAPAAGQEYSFLRGDGTWASIGLNNQIFEIETAKNETHQHAIIRAIGDTIVGQGDIIIVKDFIANGKFQYTSYVYDEKQQWIAMDGNYNAENIYFDSDFIFTESVGTIVVPEDKGRITVAAEGKNIKQFLESVFSTERLPKVEQPYITLTVQNNKLYEVGTEVTPIFEGDYNEGSYEFDNSTGVTASEWIITNSDGTQPNLEIDNNGNVIEYKGNFQTIVVDDNTNYQIRIQATLSDGIVPHTNLGNPVTEEGYQIKSQIAYAQTSNLTNNNITGFRRSFWGALDYKSEITADIIRNEFATEGHQSTNALINGSSWSLKVPQGALRIIIAYPDSLRKLTSVLDVNDSNSNIVSAFGEPNIIKIGGVNEYKPIDYKVYILDFANPYDTENIFKITI